MYGHGRLARRFFHALCGSSRRCGKRHRKPGKVKYLHQSIDDRRFSGARAACNNGYVVSQAFKDRPLLLDGKLYPVSERIVRSRHHGIQNVAGLQRNRFQGSVSELYKLMRHSLLSVIISVQIYHRHIIYAVFFQLTGKHHILKRVPDIIHHYIQEFRSLFNEEALRHQRAAACRPGSQHVTDTALYPDGAFRLYSQFCRNDISSVEVDAAYVLRKYVRILIHYPYGILAV